MLSNVLNLAVPGNASVTLFATDTIKIKWDFIIENVSPPLEDFSVGMEHKNTVFLDKNSLDELTVSLSKTPILKKENSLFVCRLS